MKTKQPPSLHEQAKIAVTDIAPLMEVKPNEIMSGNRGSWDISDGRFVLYAILRSRGYSPRAIGAALKRDRSAIEHGCRQLIMRRDVDKRFRRVLLALTKQGYQFDWEAI
jgi:hypothetical protein